MAFDFYEIQDKQAAAATISFQRAIKKMAGGFYETNLLKQNANYRRGSGHSTIRNFKMIPATAYEATTKTVDLAKIEKDFIRNGRSAEDLATYFKEITQVRTQFFRMQMYPVSKIIESDPISRTEALLAGDGDLLRGLVSEFGRDDFAEAALASETNENNNRFLDALRKTTITFKKTRWDGGIADESNDMTIDLPSYTKYTCENAYFDINDFGKMRAQMWNNMMDTPELRRPMRLLMSPNQWQLLIEKNEKLQSSDFVRTGGVLETGEIPMLMGFAVYVHPKVKDTEAYVFIPGVTVGVDDWGTFTETRSDPGIWTVTTARRQFQYDCKVVQPLTLLQVSFTGATENYPLGTPGSTTGDDVFNLVRDPDGVLN